MTIAAPAMTPARLLSTRGRAWALGIAAVASAVVLGMAVQFAGDRTVAHLDLRIMLHLYAWYPDRRQVGWRVADLSGSAAVVAITAVLVVVLLITHRRRAALLAVLGPGVAIVVTEWVLKPTVDRRLLGYLTYPSGHATGAFSVATVLALVLLAPDLRGWLAIRVAAVVAVFVVAVLVAISLVVAGYHVPTDTVGGAGVGIATVLLLAVAIDATAELRVRRR